MTGKEALALLGAVSLLVLSLLVAACSDDDEETTPDTPQTASLLPENYLATFTEVRDCRGSGDHDLNQVRMLADPAALEPYQDREQLFPEGSVVVKEEFEFDDIDCEGPVKQWTVMQRLAEDEGQDTLGWRWQRIDSLGNVATENDPRCVACHSGCGVPPDGYEGTCSIP